MQFNSYQYLIFLPIVCFTYFLLPHRFRRAMLLLASYYFYMCWRKEYVLLIIFSTLVDYFVGLNLKASASQLKRRLLLTTSIVVNLGLLFSFKYFNFFADIINTINQSSGFTLTHLNVLLPIGISFYTFQSLSYTIDLYQKKREPEKNIVDFALYVSFFPQLVAGPIERSTHLLPQLKIKQSFDPNKATIGLQLIMWGMFKKIVVADNLAEVIDKSFAYPEAMPGSILLLATYFFAFQIYCDFSAYTDIARGSAKILGIDLMKNFSQPYLSKSITEFWSRWHISLTSWFRDYLYIPLGGNRVSYVHWVCNIFIVFILSGLWHGANITFLAWGGYHSILYFLTRAAQKARLTNAKFLDSQFINLLKIIFTFHCVLLGWILFRASSIQDAALITKKILFENNLSTLLATASELFWYVLLITIILLSDVILNKQNTHSLKSVFRSSTALRWGFYIALTVITINYGAINEIPFIYFQF